MAEDDFSINVNLEEVESIRQAIDGGTYPCTVKSAEPKKKDGEGKLPYIDVRLNPDSNPRKILFLNLSFHPDALFNLKEFLLKCGYPKSELRSINPKSAAEFIRGKRIAVTVSKKQDADRGDEDGWVNEVKMPYHTC